MKSLIITVAGMSTRFNRDTKDDILKCLYYEGDSSLSLICQQITKVYNLVDEIIIVGGYKYDDLVAFADKELKDPRNRIKYVYNEHYHDYGSGFSLLKGIEAVSQNTDEIIFVEGDLFFDSESVERLINSACDAISVNNEPILSNKAVALYFDAGGYPHYIYDTSHSCLEIHEPFTAIYNSAQMWKFLNPGTLRQVCRELTPEQEQGTNLEIIQGYYGSIHESRLNVIPIKEWFNCNTVSDYKTAIKSLING